MIRNKLKECCNKCIDIDIETDTTDGFNSCGDKIQAIVDIYCNHSKVCKKYLEEIANKYTEPGYGLDHLCNKNCRQCDWGRMMKPEEVNPYKRREDELLNR